VKSGSFPSRNGDPRTPSIQTGSQAIWGLSQKNALINVASPLCRSHNSVFGGCAMWKKTVLQTFREGRCSRVDRNNSVGIATRYGLDGPGIESWWGERFSAPVHTDPGAHSASYTMGTGSFSGVKRAGRGVDQTPHLSPRLKKE